MSRDDFVIPAVMASGASMRDILCDKSAIAAITVMSLSLYIYMTVCNYSAIIGSDLSLLRQQPRKNSYANI